MPLRTGGQAERTASSSVAAHRSRSSFSMACFRDLKRRGRNCFTINHSATFGFQRAGYVSYRQPAARSDAAGSRLPRAQCAPCRTSNHQAAHFNVCFGLRDAPIESSIKKMTANKPVSPTAYLDLLRAVAIVLVVNSHLDDLYPIHQLGTGGVFGNELFFFISGYGLYLSYQASKEPIGAGSSDGCIACTSRSLSSRLSLCWLATLPCTASPTSSGCT